MAQTIEQFERVLIRAATGQEGRREPNTVEESRLAVQDPRTRVFVLFLDVQHVEGDASRGIAKPLVEALNRLIGPDDYVAAMTSTMSARDITFARRTTTIENVLKREWWGERDRQILNDPIEQQYAFCYPGIPAPGQSVAPDQGIAQEMILRRREKQTLDALEDLAVFLRGVREERKAVLTITDGWRLYTPNRNLDRPLGNATPPPIAPVNIDPRNGRLTTKDTPNSSNNAGCEADRYALSELDDQQRIRTIFDEANRANVSFYPIDPRGLVVFDEQIVPAAGVGFGPNANPDRAARRRQRAAVRAEHVAPDAGRGHRRPRNPRLQRHRARAQADHRRLELVLPPRVLLHRQARRQIPLHPCARQAPGRRRPRPAGLSGAEPEQWRGRRRTHRPAAAPTADMAIASAASAAVAKLPGAVRDLPFRVHVTAGWRPGADGRPASHFLDVGEMADRIPGSELDAVLTRAGGETVASARGRIPPGTASLLVALTPSQPVEPGDYVVRVRSQTPSGVETVSMPVALPAAPSASGAVFIRRGPQTGNKDAPTADLKFRRSERIRVEVPSAATATSARLLDRTGKPMPVPVASAMHSDADGTPWVTAEVALAPLAPGDYVIELAAGEQTRTLAAFRVVP